MKNLIKKLTKEETIRFVHWNRKRFGNFKTILSLPWFEINKPFAKVKHPFSKTPLFIRIGTEDQLVFDEIFLKKDYDIPFGDPSFIIDAGAHIGLSAVFFANRFPKATIAAIEPEPSNFNILLKNTESYPNIIPVRAAVWGSTETLQIHDPSGSTWGFRISDGEPGVETKGIGIADIMQEFQEKSIDILKMDIEGSEKEVFDNPEPWLGSVHNIIIELHDRFKPGCNESLMHALENYSYKKSKYGENLIFSDIKNKVAPSI